MESDVEFRGMRRSSEPAAAAHHGCGGGSRSEAISDRTQAALQAAKSVEHELGPLIRTHAI